MMMNRLSPFLFALAPLLTAAPVTAQLFDQDEIVQLAIRPGWTDGDGARMAAIHITLADGWKTYWRQPGDTGIPPAIDLAGSSNLSGFSMYWPIPAMLDQGGATTLGYVDEVVLPIRLQPETPGAMHLSGTIQIGVCDDVCIPVEFLIDLPLDGPGAPDPAISAALARQPDSAPALGRAAPHCDIRAIEDGLRVELSVPSSELAGLPLVVVEPGDPSIWVSAPVARVEGGMFRARVDMVPADARPFLLERSALRMTLLGDGQAVEYQGCQG